MKTTQECWQALIDGEVLVNLCSGEEVIMRSGSPVWRKDSLPCVAAFNPPENWSIYTPPKWYDNIPECLIPCRVWNYGGPIRMAFLKAYDDSYSYPFITSSGCHYGNAEQLTKQEIQQLLDNAPERGSND